MPKSNEPIFQAELYYKHRPFYPPSLFKGLRGPFRSSGTFLDLACGTGQSLKSFLNFMHSEGLALESGYAIDLDEKMLAVAERDYRGSSFLGAKPEVKFLPGSAENIPLPEGEIDTLLVGSAFHWFSHEKAFTEISRVVHPGGHLFIFEYQFPKCIDHPPLHDAIRRRFNLEWKAPIQTPRGTLADITRIFRTSNHWELMTTERPIWRERFGLSELLGHLFSQSRYLHAEAKQLDATTYRDEITHWLAPYFADGPLEFDMKPGSILFERAAKFAPPKESCIIPG